jgi:hypothetical protein
MKRQAIIAKQIIPARFAPVVIKRRMPAYLASLVLFFALGYPLVAR